MLIFLNVINPTSLTNLSNLKSEFRETSIVTGHRPLCKVFVKPAVNVHARLKRIGKTVTLLLKCIKVQIKSL